MPRGVIGNESKGKLMWCYWYSDLAVRPSMSDALLSNLSQLQQFVVPGGISAPNLTHYVGILSKNEIKDRDRNNERKKRNRMKGDFTFKWILSNSDRHLPILNPDSFYTQQKTMLNAYVANWNVN